MKKKLVSLAAAAALVVLAFSGPAWTGTKDYTGPSCNNLTGGDGIYSTFGGTEAFVSVGTTTETATCPQTTYTLYVTSSSGTVTQALVGGTAMPCPDGGAPSSSCVSWTVDMGPASSAPASVCVYATSANGTKVSDRAPDHDGSCAGLLLDTTGSGGFGGWN